MYITNIQIYEQLLSKLLIKRIYRIDGNSVVNLPLKLNVKFYL